MGGLNRPRRIHNAPPMQVSQASSCVHATRTFKHNFYRLNDEFGSGFSVIFALVFTFSPGHLRYSFFMRVLTKNIICHTLFLACLAHFAYLFWSCLREPPSHPFGSRLVPKMSLIGRKNEAKRSPKWTKTQSENAYGTRPPKKQPRNPPGALGPIYV